MTTPATATAPTFSPASATTTSTVSDTSTWLQSTSAGPGLHLNREVSSYKPFSIFAGALLRFGLLGHSMGAGMAMLYAGTFPERVAGLVMLDLWKPVSRRPDEVVERTR